MSESTRLVRAKRNYATAAILALVSGGFGLLDGGNFAIAGSGKLGAVIVGLIILAVAFGIYSQFREVEGADEDPSKAPSITRLERMTLVWYCASAVLAAKLVIGPIKALSGGAAKDLPLASWILGGFGAAVILFALFKFIVPSRKA